MTLMDSIKTVATKVHFNILLTFELVNSFEFAFGAMKLRKSFNGNTVKVWGEVVSLVKHKL